MDNEMFSFKEFENVRLKATYNIEIGNRIIEPGETIVKFDKIQIAGLNEMVSRVAARGGYGNRARVFWENTKEHRINFAQGVFSKEQLALLSNSRLITIGNNLSVAITEREILESDENGIITLARMPCATSPIFVYKKDDGEKITNFTTDGQEISITDPFVDVIVDYTFDYNNGAKDILIGRKFLNGFLELEGRTKIKDDTTGSVITGIIRVPHFKLMSDLSITLGTRASPIVANFYGVGVPVGSRDVTYVSDFCFLSDDIESDL